MLSKLIKTCGVFFVVLISGGLLRAQNYNFTNYNLKDGLPQSQVSVIFQAKDRTLWLGTYGGVSNFDGLTFTSYSKADGLFSNSISSIAEDTQNRIIIGTNNGINRIENGKVEKLVESKPVYNLQTDAKGNVWGLCNGKLFRLDGKKMEYVTFSENYRVTTLNIDSKGKLYAAVRGRGIFILQNGAWKPHKIFPSGFSDHYVVKLLFDKKIKDKCYIVTLRNGVFLYEKGVVTNFFNNLSIEGYHEAEQDADLNIWVGTQQGAYLIAPDKSIIAFNAQNGLSDNRVGAILRDRENNIWLSSFTNGIFKYEGNAFIKYDKFKGYDLTLPISGLAVDKQQDLWVSTFNKGLFKYDGNKIEQPDQALFKDKNVYLVTTDQAQNILVSMQNYGIWRYNGEKFIQMPFTEGTNISTVTQDTKGDFYLGEMSSVSYHGKEGIDKITNFKGWVSYLYSYGQDSILLGTSSGAYLIKDKKIDPKFNIAALNNTYVLSIVKQGNLLFFATLGDGIISYNVKTAKTYKHQTINGLNSNDVYSLTFDKQGILWAGTGRGINKLKQDIATGAYNIIKTNSLIVECNQNAIVNYRSNILVGTTEGIILCNANEIKETSKIPSVFFQKINVYHKTNKDKDTSIFINKKNKDTFSFNFNQNHISISYKGIFLTNPHNVLYRYRLVGLDNDFSKPVAVTQVEYSVLQPGNYTFQVYAEANGEKSGIQQFSFVVVPPFYDMLWFRILIGLLLVLALWATIYIIFNKREYKKKQREKIKLEEQAKIRTQTAEDFHDDIGNKLTRINVLSEILDKKINQQYQEEKELVRLIRENANLLYTGTKDILWALDPQSDNLFEIMQHINNFGIDLFQNTSVDFKMMGIKPEHQQLQMSMEQNRNLTLIFKELLNNVLKHAKAKHVSIEIISDENNDVKLIVKDDGVGFDLKSLNLGRGLKNIENRCKRINASLNISALQNQGTETVINIKISAIKR